MKKLMIIVGLITVLGGTTVAHAATSNFPVQYYSSNGGKHVGSAIISFGASGTKEYAYTSSGVFNNVSVNYHKAQMHDSVGGRSDSKVASGDKKWVNLGIEKAHKHRISFASTGSSNYGGFGKDGWHYA